MKLQGSYPAALVVTLSALLSGGLCASCGGSSPASSCPAAPSATVVSGGGQSAPMLSALPAPVVIQFCNQGKALSFAPTAGLLVAPDGATVAAPFETDGAGRASFTVTVPREAGAATYTMMLAGSAVGTFTATATAPARGTIFTAVNAPHVRVPAGAALSRDPVPGVSAEIGGPDSVAVAADGTLYFADEDENTVHALSPQGELRRIAGNGDQGTGGDNQPALDASLDTPAGVALDEATHSLYVSTADRVRRIDLAAGTIELFAGGGKAAEPGFGDGGPATLAVLVKPYNLALGPDGALYIEEQSRATIRRVDLTTSVITTWLAPGDCSAAAPQLTACGQGCKMAWDSGHDFYVSGYVCASPGGQYDGVLRVPAGGAASVYAGSAAGSLSDGAPATQTDFTGAIGLAFDAHDNLFVATLGDSTLPHHAIRRVARLGGLASTLAGTGAKGTTGDGGPAAVATLAGPYGLAFDAAGNLYFTEINGFDVRVVWGAGN